MYIYTIPFIVHPSRTIDLEILCVWTSPVDYNYYFDIVAQTFALSTHGDNVY